LEVTAVALLPAPVCPVDLSPLTHVKTQLRCAHGHAYPVDEISGVPTLFDPRLSPPFHSDSKDPLGRDPRTYEVPPRGSIDPFVQAQIAATGGRLYSPGRLVVYPEPQFPMKPEVVGETVVDVGAGWGRWSLAAARSGWNVVAVDPWIDCCRAMRRVATQHGLERSILTLNGDGRRLPIGANEVDAVFSYSVLQHLPKPEAGAALNEMFRVVRPGGRVLVQMPNVRGLRQRYLLQRGVVGETEFKVRPWTLPELRQLAQSVDSRARISADGFFSLNAQWSERKAMPLRSRVVVAISEAMRNLTTAVPWLVNWSDSVWIAVRKPLD
jgi:ubiquinone/menaquinone biosynthesis C-methylase UbiE